MRAERIVAELTVNGTVVRGFDRAWSLALELPRPVTIKFIRFVRKEPTQPERKVKYVQKRSR